MEKIAKRILFVSPGVASFEDYTVPDPGEGEVRVRIEVSSLSSGTERANLKGDRNTSWKRGETDPVFPKFVGGYSSAGTVESVGAGVEGLKEGDRVALSWSKYGRLLDVDAKNVYKIGVVPFEDAALFHIASFPMAAIRKCRLEIGESAVVMGLGVLGLVAVQLLKAAGAVPVIAVDPDPSKREKALSSGADLAFDPFDPGFAEKVRAATDGGCRVGIEVTGRGEGLNGILDVMARFGRVALLGCTRDKNFTVDYYRKVHGPGISLIGAHTDARPEYESSPGLWTQKDDVEALKKLTLGGRIKLSSLVDETHYPADAPAVFDRLVREPVFPVVQFDWRSI